MSDATLALEGGEPVRREPFAYQCIGGNLIADEELDLVTEVIRSRTLFRHYGPSEPHMVDDFEAAVCGLLGCRYALATATGSGAWFCAAAALGFGTGDEVIVPAFGWITDYSCVRFTGAVPVFADVDDSLNLSPESFRRKITSRTKAVIVVHYQGGASRLDEIVEIARGRGIRVIEDVAQSCGGLYEGRRLGTWGDIGCFSLQAHKMITNGDGGFLVTDSQELFERAVRFHDLGLLRATFERRLDGPPVTVPACGMQWRMGELAGAVALAQIRKLPLMLERIKECWLSVRNAIADAVPGIAFRAVEPRNDIGITLAFDLGTTVNVRFFKEAFEAEGCVYGPTSYCRTMDAIEVVRTCLENDACYQPADFAVTARIEERFAAVAVLPVYTDDDMRDVARSAVKVLGAMRERRMITDRAAAKER